MVISCNFIFIFIMLSLMVDTDFWVCIIALSVYTVLFTVTVAMSPVIVNVYTNGSVYTNGCYKETIKFTEIIQNVP